MSLEMDIQKNIDELSAIGKDPAGGITRLLYSDEWETAQKHIETLMKDIGMAVHYDQVGNLFGKTTADNPESPSILTGSHVDTVRNGGHLDGQFGIISSYLAIKSLLAEHGIPKRPLELVSFAEEEGSRFPYAFWGSKNMMGLANKADMNEAKDAEGVSFKEEMAKRGYDFDKLSVTKKENIGAFVELHIEQGIVLENLQKDLGIVTAIVGQKRYKIIIKGQANHAGTTPMNYRKDAVYAFAKMATAAIDLANAEGDPLVLTFGHVTPKPNTVNVVPGEVEFSMDCRHTDQEKLNEFTTKIETLFKKTAADMGMEITIEQWMDEPPIPMDTTLVETVKTVFNTNNYNYHIMHSGAGHDSQIIAPGVPTVMIFIPSVAGISHNPAEFTEMKHLIAGVEAMKKVLYKLAYE